MIKISKEKIKRSLELNGDLQLIIAMEELAELTQTLSKYLRGKANLTNIIEETSDVYIMLENIKTHFVIKDTQINNVTEQKLKRIK